jgi:hypothetical protein
MNRDTSRPAVPPEGKVLEFFRNLSQYPFFSELKKSLQRDGWNLDSLIQNGQFPRILEYLFTARGLNFSKKPKGLIPFYRYPEEVRTALDEQLVEAHGYVSDRKGVCRIHFTVSPETESEFRRALERALFKRKQEETNWKAELSLQKPSTQTLAVDAEGKPFRDAHCRLLFRPGGHGALLSNLQETGGEVVFIKNIDNVLPESGMEEHNRYKKALGGYLWELHKKLFALLARVEKGEEMEAVVRDAVAWAASIGHPLPEALAREKDRGKIVRGLRQWLSRPLRVCGMVRNEGEAGGGPFWVRQADGSVRRQIVEVSQVDHRDPGQEAIFRQATHFNPVDLVCLLKDFQDRPFELKNFVDPETGFISQKTEGGRPLQALEWPGLWNGAMAEWWTVFVEVPRATFHPVKTVFDLLGRNEPTASF